MITEGTQILLRDVKFHRNHPDVGKRVQLPAWSDQWMRGARYGIVARVAVAQSGSIIIYAVKCDHPGVRRQYRHFADSFTPA